MTAITTAAPGNWAVTGTWTGGVVPVAGDTVTLNHNVTIPISTTVTVGASAATDTGPAAIDVTSGFGLTNNGTLNLRGNFNCSASDVVRSYIGGPGSVLNLDTSAAASPTAQIYKIVQVAQYPGTQPSFQVNGTSGSRSIVRGVSGIGAFTGSVNYYGLVEWYYTDFTKIGDASNAAISMNMPSDTADPSARSIIDNCTFTNCGVVTTGGANLGPLAALRVKDSTFTSSAGANSLLINGFVAKTGSNTYRTITGNYFDKVVALQAPRDFTVDGNFFNEGWTTSDTSASGWASFNQNIVRCSSVGDLQVQGPFTNNIFVFDAVGFINPHCIQVATFAGVGTYNITGNIFKFTGSDYQGDCIVLGAPTGPVTINVLTNIVLPNAAGDSTGTLLSALGNAQVTMNINHNTVFMGNGGGTAIGETVAGAPGLLTSFKSNLFWDTSARAYKLFDSGVNENVVDYVTAANADYNGGYNFLTGSNLKGYNNLEFSTGSPGAHDINSSPTFVNSAAGLDTWNVTQGGAATYAAAFTRLQGNRTLIPSALTHIRAGFAPQNAAYNNTGHDGTAPGAIAYLSLASSYSVTKTIGIGVPDPIVRELTTNGVIAARLIGLGMTETLARTLSSLSGVTLKDANALIALGIEPEIAKILSRFN